MRLVGLDGRVYAVVLKDGRRDDCSGPHLQARLLLQTLYPLELRLEEITLPGAHGLRADFLLPARRLIVEVQGQQHAAYTPFFHKNVPGFWAGRENDADKTLWCELNDFRLVCLWAGEEDEVWRARLRSD